MSAQGILTQKLRLSVNPGLINKNDAKDDKLYRDGWVNQSLTPFELAAEINKGVAYACELSGARNTGNFVCSDILSVDIDGTWTIPEAMADPFVERHLTILYTTPSHTETAHRFRLIFALPRCIDTPQEMRAALRSVALKLGGDRSATDPARIFFGSSGSNPQIFDRALSSDALDELIAHGLQSDQRDIAAPGYTTTVSKQPIAAERMITLATGETRPFRDLETGTRVCCPFHHDTNASAFVTASKTGTTGIHCSTCAQTFWPPNTATTDDFADFDNRVIEAEKYFSENEDMGAFQKFLTGEGHQYHPGLARSHILRQQNQFIQLPTPIPKGLVFVKSPKGTGKTEELRRMLSMGGGKRRDSLESLLEDNSSTDVADADLIPGDESVLLIGHRIALIRQSCLRLGLECYLDFEGSLPNKRLGICLDSLQRLTWRQQVSTYKTEQKENLFQTIIIDESEQVLSHFLSDTIDPIRRDALFKIFASLLQHSKRVIALDADLGWLTFETLSKLAQPRDEKPTKRSTLVTNDRTTASPIQIFKSKAHLIGDLRRSVEDGQRVFVTSNSLNQVTKLYEGFIADAETSLRCILITSETMASDEVRAFVGNAKEKALDYDVILTSPSLGTGVDITFPDQEQLIDVVYGIFESGITTHFDFDQQIWRVRHPGAVKVWISPRKFSFDTATDVVKRDIQQKQLYKSVLSDYDENLTPAYHTNDPLIDMAVLARSQQLLSKNNLKRNFIAMKRRHGHTIDLIDKDDGLADDVPPKTRPAGAGIFRG